MPLSWNEIRDRALAFSREWAEETSEDAEAKSFWDDFFDVFGVTRRRLASFEQPVKKGDDKTGYIDLLWKGWILVEHKSRGKDLDKAFRQAKDYFPGIKERDLPKYILVSDFARFRLYDPLTMPPDLRKALDALDKAVDSLYGKKSFTSDAERVAFLFARYEQLTQAPLEKMAAKPKRKAAGRAGAKS